MSLPVAMIKALRPKQWTKNALLLAGIVFTQNWGNQTMMIHAILGVAIFCALSSVVYLVNDILDVERDRQHPKKRLRPIAAGALPVPLAWGMAVGLTLLGLGGAFKLTFGFGVCAAAYLILTCGYSFYFKHVVIADIMILALGFVLRALGGIEVISIPGAVVPVTSYFLLTTLFLALFLAICKRRNELVLLGDAAAHHRQVLGDYSVEFLDVILTVATAGTLFSYALWTTQGKFAIPPGGKIGMIYTMPFVVYGIFRYIWLVYKRDEGGAPEALLFEDIPLLFCVVGWVASTVSILAYLSKFAGVPH